MLPTPAMVTVSSSSTVNWVANEGGASNSPQAPSQDQHRATRIKHPFRSDHSTAWYSTQELYQSQERKISSYFSMLCCQVRAA
jgi:hypothetical protein